MSGPAPGFYALSPLPGSRLALALFVLGVLADDHNAAFALDHLALFADGLHGRFNFHFIHLSLIISNRGTLRRSAFRRKGFKTDYSVTAGTYLERHVIRPLFRS